MKELPVNAQFAQESKSIVTFRFLSDDEISQLMGYATQIQAEEGEVIVNEGDVSPHFYGILSGTVSVEVSEAKEKDVFVCALGPGDVFGEAGIFVSVKRTASVKALGEVRLIRLHRNDMVKFIRTFPEAGNKILMVIIHGLLRKLRLVNHELAYERKSDMDQDDIDQLVANIFSDE